VLIFWIQQAWKHLTVVNIGRSYSISADETMVDIDVDTVLVTVVIDVVLFDPANV
jgi:hypothetical protein